LGPSALTNTGTTFRNNTGEDGGAVYSWVTNSQGTTTVTVTGCLFDSNQSKGPAADYLNVYGGGISVQHTVSGTGSASLSIQNSTFYQNWCDNHGGAIALYNSNTGSGTNTVKLTSLTVYKNQAATDGGGLWSNMTAPALLPQVWNSIIAGNLWTSP
jgi:predicted outer membrane repeat protein